MNRTYLLHGMGLVTVPLSSRAHAGVGLQRRRQYAEPAGWPQLRQVRVDGVCVSIAVSLAIAVVFVAHTRCRWTAQRRQHVYRWRDVRSRECRGQAAVMLVWVLECASRCSIVTCCCWFPSYITLHTMLPRHCTAVSSPRQWLFLAWGLLMFSICDVLASLPLAHALYLHSCQPC